jgi:hypothetical protein
VSVSVGVHTHALIQPARQRQEVLNRRLFSTVREKKRLTYDANFHLTGFERIHGGWYVVLPEENTFYQKRTHSILVLVPTRMVYLPKDIFRNLSPFAFHRKP